MKKHRVPLRTDPNERNVGRRRRPCCGLRCDPRNPAVPKIGTSTSA
ncbi:hypothetical protein LI99_16760 [Mycolicibacterium smegmatis]|uniref:Uncharacterized protein n=1 Tax=Mycolicibacterium smegmatis (strain ATCC 700084 / mc(2)155) TaxID=246196 RepID=A0QXN7_MYCS2|nr:hypothetical protein MSMEG_3368 [Mycolicibacterium smegmatis MC2 155]AIU15136.1 hypothetical protein LI99_16760 [Mycolicibacterium smegmatis]AIU08511.1 hypothetical protein LJ00_16755 [Mycolicibacterium smegmatis MC2 155]AIU21759.1 hypothetical protein LI98_16765 [Mycolicibacterium smegmatis]TBH29414.1 hypothetical protein EYS45_27500 [Mycolicibacterium smegmatis MC2 155]